MSTYEAFVVEGIRLLSFTVGALTLVWALAWTAVWFLERILRYLRVYQVFTAFVFSWHRERRQRRAANRGGAR